MHARDIQAYMCASTFRKGTHAYVAGGLSVHSLPSVAIAGLGLRLCDISDPIRAIAAVRVDDGSVFDTKQLMRLTWVMRPARSLIAKP